VHRRLAQGGQSEFLAGLGAKLVGGRFTPRGAFETLYVATTAETARIEAEARITASGVSRAPSQPYVHFVVRGRMKRVLDLTNPLIIRALETTLEELAAPWVPAQASGGESATQTLGRAVHATRLHEAILFSSVMHKRRGRCLAIFPDRLRKGSSLQIVDETGLVRERLQ